MILRQILDGCSSFCFAEWFAAGLLPESQKFRDRFSMDGAFFPFLMYPILAHVCYPSDGLELCVRRIPLRGDWKDEDRLTAKQKDWQVIPVF